MVVAAEVDERLASSVVQVHNVAPIPVTVPFDFEVAAAFDILVDNLSGSAGGVADGVQSLRSDPFVEFRVIAEVVNLHFVAFDRYYFRRVPGVFPFDFEFLSDLIRWGGRRSFCEGQAGYKDREDDQ